MNDRYRSTSVQAVSLVLCVLFGTTHAQQAPALSENDPTKYELSTVVKSLMVSTSTKTGFQGDYLYFKSLLSGIRLLSTKEINTPSPGSFPGNADDYLHIYEGKLPLFIKGQRFLAENMEDKYLWSAHFAGPQAYVSSVYIRSEKPVVPRIGAGASYFSAAGLKLDALSCEKLGGSNTNYSAYYRVSAPSKYPIVLGISKSTGSGGVWYSYEIAWYGVKAASLGKEAVLGMCDIVD
jgi:hypothetical protein